MSKSEGSAHIINFNSPGASGAPAYSAFVVAGLRKDGHLDGFTEKVSGPLIQGWDFKSVTSLP